MYEPAKVSVVAGLTVYYIGVACMFSDYKVGFLAIQAGQCAHGLPGCYACYDETFLPLPLVTAFAYGPIVISES
jgi:hypothetical protein